MPQTKEERKASCKRYYDSHIEVCRARCKQYREGHRAKLREYAHNYYDENKDTINAKRRAKRAADTEGKENARQRAYYEAHKEKMRAYRRAYYKAHKEEIKAQHADKVAVAAAIKKIQKIGN